MSQTGRVVPSLAVASQITMELARLIEHLSDPRAYPDATAEVDVHQTHISVVFVTDTFAYKIKKPITLDFLDYSTLEKRRHWCEEEVRLNRRLAPRSISVLCRSCDDDGARSRRGHWPGGRVGGQDAQAARRGKPGSGRSSAMT